MGYLVICPTCGGKMSVNADRCPHCGETEFFKYAASTRVVGSKSCKHCGATGLVWRYDATAMSYNPGGMHGAYNVLPGQFKIKIGNDTFVIEDVKPEMRSRFETCIRNHDYEITFIRKALHSIKYDQDACPECNGNGKINDVAKEYSRIDLRKKA